VEEGEVVGFLGRNGAGKSTTIRTLMGFLEPTEGVVELFGMSPREPHARSEVGYLPEVAQYYPYLTPIEALRMFGELQGDSPEDIRQEIARLLPLVGLAERGKEQIRNFSKGMRQRLGIAQALLGGPKLLILDEVSSGLDPIGRRELREILQAEKQEGTTIFFSSHELSEVTQLCDRLLILDNGRLIADVPLSSLRGRDLEDYFISQVLQRAA
jgi:ABC-2 type transport system ATP-binding protein